MDERHAVMKSDRNFIGRIGLVCQPIARIAKQGGEALANFMVGHANVFSRWFDTTRPTSKSVPTENSVCPSTIRQSPCSIVTFGIVPEGRTVGASIWMLLMLTLFACNIILANHRLAPRARYSGVLRCSKDAGTWLL
jgi:hypothetical protein